MADLTITATNLVAGVGAKISTGQAGESLAAGDIVYADSTDGGNLKKCLHNGTAAQAAAVGIALAAAADDAAFSYITEGDLCFGTILTIGEIYVVSATAGLIAVEADPGSADFMTIVGVAKATGVLAVKISVSGLAIV